MTIYTFFLQNKYIISFFFMEENRFLKHEKVQLEVVFFIAFMAIHDIEIFRPCD